MRRLALLLVTFVVTVTAFSAAAASLGVASHGFGAGDAAVDRCGDSFDVDYTVSSEGKVTAVTLSDFDEGCTEGALSFVLVNADGTAVAQGVNDGDPLPGTSLTRNVTPQPTHDQVKGVRLVVVGP